MRYLSYHALLIILLLIVPPAAAGEKVTVIFDHGHGQKFMFNRDGDLQLSGMSGVFHNAGYHLMEAPGRATPVMLSYADVFVISGPFLPYSEDEADAVVDFVKKGGRLAVMAHITSPIRNLLDRLNIKATGGTIRESDNTIEGKNSSFSLSVLSDHPVTDGLNRFNVYGAWGLKPAGDGQTVIARSGPGSWEDKDRNDTKDPQEEKGPFSIVISGSLGRGKFIVFGDDAIFQNRFLKDENRKLAENLARWLKK